MFRDVGECATAVGVINQTLEKRLQSAPIKQRVFFLEEEESVPTRFPAAELNRISDSEEMSGGELEDRCVKGIQVLVAPTSFEIVLDRSVGNAVQVSAHSVQSKSFIREAKYVFPAVDLSNLIVISTMQHARHDLVQIGEEIELEKDRLILTVSFENDHSRFVSIY